MLLVITAHRLPAPIIEETTPTPSQRATKARPQIPELIQAPVKKTPSVADQEVRVVISENTRLSLMHLRTYVETGEKIPFAPKTDVKPDEIMDRLRQVLSSRFRNVSVLNEGARGRPTNGLTMLFDLQAHVGMTSGETNSVVLSATFKDGSGHITDTITASGATKVPYPAWRTHFPEALAAAFTEFSQKLSRVRW